jgi:hypothetical protein
MIKNKIIYICHLVDTEGPLSESLSATFQRINEIFNCKILPSKKNLKLLKNQKYFLKNYIDKKKISKLLHNNKINTFNNWRDLFHSILKIKKKTFKIRSKFNWVFTWCFLSHDGFEGTNPRKRTIGYGKIFFNYIKKFKKNISIYKIKHNRDSIAWHFHAPSITNDAHRGGSTYLGSRKIFEDLCNYIINYTWFPSVFRAGHNTVRQDLNLFLEQWIPFDFSNTSYNKIKKLDRISSPNRYGNWSKAPISWIPYNPNYVDYQLKGDMKRYVARCLPINEREYSITSKDIFLAFNEAKKNGRSLLCFTNHDFRDMSNDIDQVIYKINDIQKKYPSVQIKFTNAINGIRQTLKYPKKPPKIGISAHIKKIGNQHRLYVFTSSKIFGTQPFLAIKDKKNQYFWQNFDYEKKNLWSYSFDSNNILFEKISGLGIASNNKYGLTEVLNYDFIKKKFIKKIYNQ